MKQRKAYLTKEVSILRKYLTMSQDDRAYDFLSENINCFVDWLEVNDHLYDELESYLVSKDKSGFDLEDACYLLDVLPKNILLDAYEECRYNVDHMLPTYEYVEYVDLLKNQWLIHFTDEPFSVQKYGFTSGVDDITKLGLTTHLPEIFKQGPGFNFAYTLSDYLRGSGSPVNPHARWSYGKHAVMFKASGIRVLHLGDEEYQAIFWGPSARDIVVLYKDYCFIYDEKMEDSYEDDAWVVVPCNADTDNIYCAKDFEDVVVWVANNFDQYKNLLVCK